MNVQNIINWFLSKLELIITIIGFVITFIQLAKTKKTVIASKEATEKTFQLLADRSTISDLSSIVSGIRETQTALRGNRYEAALIRTQELRIKMFELRSRKGFMDEAHLTDIQEIVVTLKRIQDTLEKKISDPENQQIIIYKMNNKLSGLIGQISSWNEEMFYDRRSDEK